MAPSEKKIQALVRDLPDRKSAIVFLERMAKEQPRVWKSIEREPALLSDLLALAAWSPLLATTLEQCPEYISWLSRERRNSRVRTSDELKESLARFALTNSSLDPQVLLARFRRRELLRVYLHDVRRTHTIVETTEELSNLADAILAYALSLARQDLDNKYGAPQLLDGRGRVGTAEFCVVALGKLGSYELNYASDIDLLFLYSDDGTTSGTGTRGEVTNREYFIKLAETVTRLVGQQTGEGAAYRVDLRLRPFGRDGALASSLNEALRYYREKAQQWELQALIRARTAAGWPALYLRFAQAIRANVFRAEVSVPAALASVRSAKQKIDHQETQRARGFNVKLGRGGIREIEFIAQALQLAHGGRDRWLRVPHTLIILGRLADRELISAQERSDLSDAYAFLRTLEHRLQMEHGLQTHIIPPDTGLRELVARRMNFEGAQALADFDSALQAQTDSVHRAYERLFGGADEVATTGADATLAKATPPGTHTVPPLARGRPVDSDAAAAYAAATLFAPHVAVSPQSGDVVQLLAERLKNAVATAPDPHRALMLVSRVASSFGKSTDPVKLREEDLVSLSRLCGASEFFAEMVAGNPLLISSLGDGPSTSPRELSAEGLKSLAARDYRAVLRASIDAEHNFAAELSALRRTWARLLLEIGKADAAGEMSLGESNQLQTELAVASINAAYFIARREAARKFGNFAGGPRLAVLGLGRVASGGVDYGSDLDIIIIYDSVVPSPLALLTPDEAYARLAEWMISALSSITRTGHLYRVDLRLRPDGNDGPLVSGSNSFLDYLRQRAAVWEWLAYVKLRAVAGDLELGRAVETEARLIIHAAARNIDQEVLQSETRRVRDRLQQEKIRPGSHDVLDIKYGAGGMLDVYFAVRYLQLRDNLPDEGADRSTVSTLDRLKASGSLSAGDYEVLRQGYRLLRTVDHQQRLLMGRSSRLPGTDHPATNAIAGKLGYDSAPDLREALVENMTRIRRAFDTITQSTTATVGTAAEPDSGSATGKTSF